MKLIISMVLALFATFQLQAQNRSNDELLGDKYMFSYSYSKAVEAYSKSKTLTTLGSRNLAMSYHKLDKDLQADSVYSTYIGGSNGILPEDYYNYAQVLKCIGKIYLSNQYMDKFTQLKPADLRAIDYTTNKHLYDTWLTDNKIFKIELLKINTGADDFGPAYYMDKIVFTSSRSDGKSFPKADNWHNQPYLDMYVADVNENQLSNQTNFSNSLNGKMHDGPASFTKDGKTIVFTRNNYDDKSKDRVIELQLFISKNTDGKWSDPEPFLYNNVNYSVGHPSLSLDGNTLYFASNMPGGFGKADIYKCKRNSEGTWTKPENLGNKINTEGDEVFPFYEENSKTLFYSSDGKFGLGGLDIFMCKLDGSGVGTIINLGVPLNSTADDFSAIANEKMTRGYFASNRKGGAGSDDMYAFEIPYNKVAKSVKGIVMQKSGIPINKVMVSLYDINGNRIDSFLTNTTGAYNFNLEKDKGYTIIARNSNYIEGKTLVQTLDQNDVITANITLVKIPIVDQIKPKANLTQILELNEIYFGLNQSSFTQESINELEKIVNILNEYPKMVIDVHSYTDCRASEGYNQILSDQRAKATIKYLKSRISKPARISGKGYGETKLSSNCPCENNNITNCTDEEYKAQRNTEFIIISQ